MSQGRRQSKADILQGTLDLMVLKTLAAKGTIYLCLVRLVQKGWIHAEWGTSENNRRAKFYSISKAGGKQLVAETQNWERVAGIIGRLLQLGTRG